MLIIMIILLVLMVIGTGLLVVLVFRNPDTRLLEFEKAIRNEMADNRVEIAKSIKDSSDTSSKNIMGLTQLNEQKLKNLQETVKEGLKSIQEDSTKKLEQMRATVDEKLHDTLEKRLGESFRIVSERLEKVREGLGEMKVLATGVGDLKKVLTNVKTRGSWGEIQLGTLLDQILTPEQYAQNVPTKKGSRENVEYAIKLPGKDEDVVWLPIDAKFPKEDYERLLDAQDNGDIGLIEEIGKALEGRIKSEAKVIRDKYINPPNTTDFGILFLATEGLYAEVIRRPGLCEFLQREYRIIVTGPTTIAALLNSLQMGFRTLAIEKRASEVWNLLGAVKAEFGKFGRLLDKTHKQLTTVANTIEGAARKSRTIERKLKGVQDLPVSKASKLLSDAPDGDDEVEVLEPSETQEG